MADWTKIAFVRSSELRFRILVELSASKLLPGELVERLEKHASHVSRALGELSEAGLAVCLAPTVAKGRYYDITPAGRVVLAEIAKAAMARGKDE
ncbi:MAG: hypothetical protein HY556_05995 [Euryarchaeota archaeon]|nr:hypothetical protein [Euryarchaeota archaeon]